MKINKSTLLELFSLNINDSEDGFRVVESSDWTHNTDKYEVKRIILEKDGNFYSYYNSRSGSPFTDWYYDSEYWSNEIELDEVIPVEKTITIWKNKQ